jgi:hypothetical protein
MQRRWFVVLAIVLVGLTAGSALPASAASGADRSSPAQDSPQLGTPEGFNNTEFRLSVYENGTTRWTISHYRFLGDNESKIDQYQSFADRFKSTETETYRDFKTRARALTSFGAKETNRQMNATAFSKDAYIEQQFRGKVGVLEMSFSWTNFAQTTDRGVTVGDVFDGGMYIGPNQRLIFENSSGLVFESADPGQYKLEEQARANLTASSTLEYQGERNFADARPRVVLVRPDISAPSTDEASPTVATTDSEPTTGTVATTAAKSNDFGTMPLAFAILFLLVLGGVIAWYTGNLGSVIRDGGDTDAGSATTLPSETESPAEPDAPTESAVPEEELLSDEDRVLKLLEENGGRMKQVNIVENTEWSKSKVSMLLSDMAEEGLISKLRVGRENIISKAGEEPDAVGSPFDDE